MSRLSPYHQSRDKVGNSGLPEIELDLNGSNQSFNFDGDQEELVPEKGDFGGSQLSNRSGTIRGNRIAAEMDELEMSVSGLYSTSGDEDSDNSDSSDMDEDEGDLDNSALFGALSARNNHGQSKRLSTSNQSAVSPSTTEWRRVSASAIVKEDAALANPIPKETDSPESVTDFIAQECKDISGKGTPASTKKRRPSGDRKKKKRLPNNPSRGPPKSSKSTSRTPVSRTRSQTQQLSRPSSRDRPRSSVRSKSPGRSPERSHSPPTRRDKKTSNRRREASRSPARRTHRSKSPNRPIRVNKKSGRDPNSKKTKMDRSNQSHIRRKEEHRSRDKNAPRKSHSASDHDDPMGSSVGNFISVQNEPVLRRRNRRTRGTPRDNQNAQMAASCSGLDFEPVGTDPHRGPQELLLDFSSGSKIVEAKTTSEEAVQLLDENQKKKKKGVMSTFKKKFLAGTTKRDKEKAKRKDNDNETVAAASPAAAPVVDETLTDNLNTVSDDNYFGEEAGAPTSRHRTRRSPSDNMQPDLMAISGSQQEETEYDHRKKSLDETDATQAKELKLVEDEERDNRRSQRREEAKVASGEANERQSNVRLGAYSSADEGPKEPLPRRRQKRSEAAAAASAARARARREGVRAGEVGKSAKRTVSQSAAAEAAARARIRARKKGILLNDDESLIGMEEDEDKRKMRHLHDDAMAAVKATAKAKVRARDMVRSLSIEAAEAATKRRVVTGDDEFTQQRVLLVDNRAREMVRTISNEAADAATKRRLKTGRDKFTQQRGLPVDLRRQLSGEVPQPALRKVRKGTKKSRKIRSEANNGTRRNNPYLSSGDEQDPVEKTGVGSEPKRRPRKILSQALKRELTGEGLMPTPQQKNSREEAEEQDPVEKTGLDSEPKRRPRKILPLALKRELTGESLTPTSRDEAQRPFTTKSRIFRKASEDSEIVSESDGSVEENQPHPNRCPSALQFDPTRKNNLEVLSIGVGNNGGNLNMTSGHTAPPVLNNARDSTEALSIFGAEFGGDDDIDDDEPFQDEAQFDGNKSSSRMPGAVKWIRRKTKKATQKLLTKTSGGDDDRRSSFAT